MSGRTADRDAAPPLPSPKERRRLREAKALSEEQIATAVGVTRATVRSWETGRATPRGRKREAYARLICSAGQDRRSLGQDQRSTGQDQRSLGQGRRSAGRDQRTSSEVRDAPGVRRPAPVTRDEPVPERAPFPAAAALPEVAPERAVVPASTTWPMPEEFLPNAAEGATGASGRQVANGASAGTPAGASGGGPAGPDGDGSGAARTPTEAFDALHAHSAAGLFHQTYLLTGRRVLSREAVAHAFDQAWQRWPEVAVDRDPVGWLRATAYEYAMSPWHRLRRAHRRPDQPPAGTAARALLDALLELPPPQRRTLLLHDGVGLGLPETAAETEASTPATARRLLNARAAVSERLPEFARPPSPAERSALMRERLGALALTQPVASLPSPSLIRNGSERKAQLWTRAAISFTVLIIGLTLITLATAPRHYETPQSPPQQVEGVPPRGGPQKLTPQDKKLRKQLGEAFFRGPARLSPGTTG